jgi:hypothetical protein
MQQTPQKPRILFCNPVIHARDVYEALCSVAQKVTVESKSRLEFLEDVKTKYNDVLVIYTTAKTFGVGDISTSKLFVSAFSDKLSRSWVRSMKSSSAPCLYLCIIYVI